MTPSCRKAEVLRGKVAFSLLAQVSPVKGWQTYVSRLVRNVPLIGRLMCGTVSICPRETYLVFVVTMHGSVYAFDTDDPNPSPLWYTSIFTSQSRRRDNPCGASAPFSAADRGGRQNLHRHAKQPGDLTGLLRCGGLFGKHFSDTADLGTHALQLLFDVLVAAVDVVDAVDDRLAVRNQGSEHQ